MKSKMFCSVLFVLVFLFAGCFCPYSFAARDFPAREVTMLLPYSAGGPVDLTARVLAEEAGKVLGQAVVSVNQPGGGGILNLNMLKTKQPDGYTLAVAPVITSVAVPQQRKVPFDPLKDFDYIIHHLAIRGGIVCRNDSPWKSMKDLLDFSRKNPGQVTYACPGAGGASHIGAEAIAKKEGLKWRMLPYKGSIDCATALMGGHVDLAICDFVPWKDLVKAGRLRIMVLEEEPRQAFFPEATGYKEMGYTVTIGGEFGVVAPKGTPSQALKIFHDAFKTAMETENYRETCKKLGVFPVYRSSKDYEAHINQQFTEIGRILKDLGMVGK
jgi:tripartite-type tricarboxylate transporter receptor subunit TctC